MTRITINNPSAGWAVPLLATIALLAGCSSSDDYHRKDLAVDSPAGKQITQMLDELHQLDPSQLDAYVTRHVAEGMSDGQRAGLKALFAQWSTISQVKLQAVDRFGGDVFRARLLIGDSAAPRTADLLLVEVDHRLRWAGMN